MARKFRTKEWAVMLFIANDNDLGAITFAKIDEIGRTASTPAADVIIQFDTPGKNFVRRMRLSRLRRFHGKLRKFPLPHLQHETDTGDKETLIRFIDLTLTDFKRHRRRMLVISNHGTGFSIARDEFLGRTPLFRKVARRKWKVRDRFIAGAQRELNADALDNLELKAALQETAAKHGPLDVLAFDACLMCTFEVAYQLRETARVMVASQSNIPVPGCEFTPTFELMRHEKLSSADVARALVDNSVLTQLVFDEYSAMAALDLGKAAALAEAISLLAKTLAQKLADAKTFDAIGIAHLSALSFRDSETIDLFDFCQKLARNVDDREIQSATTAVLIAIGLFVLRSNPRGAVVQGARGISITLPRRNYISDSYRELDFARDTAWVDFLEAYLPQRFSPLIVGV
jgi:hypothetical protein